MPTVAMMVDGLTVQELALDQIGTAATVLSCCTVDSLIDLVGQGGVDAVVADLHDTNGTNIMPALAAFRRQAPHLPLILYCLPTPAALRNLPDLIAVTRGLNVVFRNCEHLGLALSPLLHPPRVASAGETLARHVVPIVPGPFRPFVLVSALKASPALNVETIAGWSGVPRRTLQRMLQRARLPSAGEVLGSCIALHVAWWLDVQGWSAKQIVTEMRFSHESGIVRVLRHYFGCSIRTLRDEGGFQELLRRFESTLLGGAAPGRRAEAS